MSPKPSVEELQHDVTDTMLRVFNKLVQTRRQARDYGTGTPLTFVEAQICLLVAESESISPSALAEVTGVSRPAVSQVLSKLRARGFVTSSAVKGDGRSRRLSVTRKGRVAADGVLETYDIWAASVMADSGQKLQANLEFARQIEAYMDRLLAQGTEGDPAE